jgi:hypothetical protein
MDRIQRLAVMACSVALALAGSSGFAQQTPKYTNAEVVKVRAQERLLVIKNTDGVEQTLELDDHVVGIGELRPGDRVILTLRGESGRSRVESFAKSEKSEASLKSEASQARVAPRQQPGAVVDDTGDETRASAAFEARVSALAQQSVRVDTLWASFRTSCNVLLRGGAAYDGARPWLSLWDGTAQVDLSSGNCRDMYNQVVSLGQAVSEAMADAEESAGRVLSPGQIREIERRHSLEWGGWGRGAPELRDHR